MDVASIKKHRETVANIADALAAASELVRSTSSFFTALNKLSKACSALTDDGVVAVLTLIKDKLKEEGAQ